MQVVTYSRVSTSDKGQNPLVQRDELRRYCSARGWTVVQEIVDHGYSGSTDDRPGLKRLFLLVARREVDAVAVVKLDRLFRSLRHLVRTLEEWQALGVVFCATADAVDYSTPGGRLFAQILGCLAEFERSLLQERTRAGLAYARAQGRTLGRPKTRDDERILALRADGLTYRAIQVALGCSRGAVYRAVTAVPKTSADGPIKNAKKTGTGDA